MFSWMFDEHRWRATLGVPRARQAANSERNLDYPLSPASQDSLPDIGNVQSDKLGVVEGSELFGKVRHLCIKVSSSKS